MDNGLNKRSRVSDFICMLLVFVFIFSILLVRLHLFSMPLTNIYWTEALDTSTLSDLFSYWKAMTILCAGCLFVIVAIVAYFKDRIRFKKSFLYIPTLIYTAFVFLSLFFSNYKYFALRGMQDHFEGTIVLLSYILLLFFLFNAIDSDRRVKMVIMCVLGTAFLLGLLGLGQGLGHDFFMTVTGQKAITPNYTLDNGLPSWAMIDILADKGDLAYNFSFAKGVVYQTVYNANYVPLYLSLLIPICAILFIFFFKGSSIKNRVFALLSLALFGLLLYNFFAANSASGFFGLVAIVVSALFIFRKEIKEVDKTVVMYFDSNCTNNGRFS